jgi:hypothetical protein
MPALYLSNNIVTFRPDHEPIKPDPSQLACQGCRSKIQLLFSCSDGHRREEVSWVEAVDRILNTQTSIVSLPTITNCDLHPEDLRQICKSLDHDEGFVFGCVEVSDGGHEVTS